MAGLAAAAALVVPGCGGEAGDLIAIEISGGIAGNQGGKRIVVTEDGRARCGDGELEAIDSQLLIEAREAERELKDLAEEAAVFSGRGADRRQYVARTRAGTVRWFEGQQGNPKVLPETELLALKLDREVCR